MKLPEMPFTALDWSVIEPVEVPGATGTSYWRSFEVGDLRVRIVDYGPKFTSDHWCDRGHVLHVLSGVLGLRLKGGREITLASGEGFCVSDHGDAAHLVFTEDGCRAFIVD
jgi:hypothetical protein